MTLRPESPGWTWVLLGLGGVSGVLVWSDGSPASGFRHLYLLPTLLAACSFGGLGGGVAGLLAALLHAPLVLPAIERDGLTPEALEGLISLGLFPFVGGVAGALARRAQVQAGRYRLLLGLQETLAGGGTLRQILDATAGQLRAAFGAGAVGIALAGQGSEPLVAGRADGADEVGPLRSDSVAAWVLRVGQPVFVGDLASDGRCGPGTLAAERPRRVLVVPLCAREGRIGVLAVERRGEFPRDVRAAVETVALHLALGIENGRLTERQRRFAAELEGKVAAATQRLQELDRAKSDFVSAVSHEIRTPLTAIQGFSELLLCRPVSPDRARRFLELIHQEAERLGRIVGDLLDLSRIESGRASGLRLGPVMLEPIITANLELIGAQSPRHRIQGEIPADLPPVCADPDAMDRVLKNLLSNAVKYSPRGGPIRVWAQRVAGDPEQVEVGVEDRGIGIPSKALPWIFETYSRVPHPDTSHVRGLGIGLALVKSLLEAQGGRIRVESQPGVGSRFILILPSASQSEKPQSG